MRIAITSVLLVLLCAAVGGQDAKVFGLSEADARMAKIKWNELQDAQKEWDLFNRNIAERYTEQDGVSCTTGLQFKVGPIGCHIPKEGWSGGFTYSTDFKYIVPKTLPIPIQGSGGSCWLGNGYFGSCGAITPGITLTPGTTVIN